MIENEESGLIGRFFSFGRFKVESLANIRSPFVRSESPDNLISKATLQPYDLRSIFLEIESDNIVGQLHLLAVQFFDGECVGYAVDAVRIEQV